MKLYKYTNNLKLYFYTFIFLIVYFYLFLHSNKLLLSFDWYAINSWLSIWKLSFEKNEIPYYVNMFVNENFWGEKYFAIPYIIVSPQIFLLKFISINDFIFIHILISCSIGFIGIIKFHKNFNLNTLSFFTLVMFFYLGGFWTNRISVGHIQNSFYFAIPTFLWLLYDFLHNRNTIRSSFIFAIFLFIGLMQGSLHVIYQYIFVLFIFTIFSIKKSPYFLLIFVTFILLSLYFIIPNLFFSTYNSQIREVFYGYGTPSIDAIPNISQNKILNILHLKYLIKIFLHFVFSFFYLYNPDYDAVWEFSLLCSPIIFYYLYLLFKKTTYILILKYKYILLPIIILILLSIGPSMRILFNFIQLIFLGKFPIVDRLPSRIFIYPFSILFLFSIIHIRQKIKIWHIAVSLIFLLINSYNWRLDYTLSKIRNDNIILNPKILIYPYNNIDDNYIQLIKISYIISLIFLLIISFYVYKSKQSTK